jgi:hypothetical protein
MAASSDAIACLSVATDYVGPGKKLSTQDEMFIIGPADKKVQNKAICRNTAIRIGFIVAATGPSKLVTEVTGKVERTLRYVYTHVHLSTHTN